MSGLGVPALARLRHSIVTDAEHPRQPLSPAEFAVTHAVLDTLGIGLEPVHVFMFRALPTLRELERWVLEQVGGSLDPRRVQLANAIAAGDPPDPQLAAEIAALEALTDVLSGEDLAFWEENGYVIVREAAPLDACRALERAIWDHLRADPDDPDSWYDTQVQAGVMVQLFNAPGIAEIHSAPRIRKAFAQLLGTGDLVISTDRCGFNPPVQPGFPYQGPKLHFDLTSFATPVTSFLQGILYLTDTAAAQGAFRCVPGFHKRIDAWLASLPPGCNPTLVDLEAFGPVPIAASGSDLIIWNAALPHGPSTNTGARPRLVHYLTMYPAPRASARS